MEMVKTKLILFGLLCLCVCSCAQIYKWESVSMNGSRTGCVATTTDNCKGSLDCNCSTAGDGICEEGDCTFRREYA